MYLGTWCRIVSSRFQVKSCHKKNVKYEIKKALWLWDLLRNLFFRKIKLDFDLTCKCLKFPHFETSAYCFYIKLRAKAVHSLKINKEIILWRHVWNLKYLVKTHLAFFLISKKFRNSVAFLKGEVLLYNMANLYFLFVSLNTEKIGIAMLFHVFQILGVMS